MKNTKTITKGSLVAGIILAAAGLNANASSVFSFSNLGNGNTVRTNLLKTETNSKTLELKCAAKKSTSDSSAMKKGKDGKCGEGKCGANKKKMDSTSTKGKDAKCAADKKGM